jgi:hypothetical protein
MVVSAMTLLAWMSGRGRLDGVDLPALMVEGDDVAGRVALVVEHGCGHSTGSHPGAGAGS